MKEGFQNYLIKNAGISADEAYHLTYDLRYREVSKGSFLFREGDVLDSILFVEKGLLRIFTIDGNGKEHIMQFAPENWWFSDRGSLFFNEPSDYFVEAVEDSIVILIDGDFFASKGSVGQRVNKFNYRLLNNHVRHLQKRINMLLSATAEQRYLDFITVYPDITTRVPQWMIASYLGITPESLSRVRRELVKSSKHQ